MQILVKRWKIVLCIEACVIWAIFDREREKQTYVYWFAEWMMDESWNYYMEIAFRLFIFGLFIYVFYVSSYFY